MMVSNRVEALSDRQAECLRLLARGLSAKNIAAELDLSYETVNAHLKAARRALGVNRSADAARLLAESEREQPRESVGNHWLAMPGDGEPGPETVQRTATVDTGTDVQNELRDARTPFRTPFPEHPAARAWGRRYDELKPASRMTIIAFAMVACVIVVAGLVAIAGALQAMLWSIFYNH